MFVRMLLPICKSARPAGQMSLFQFCSSLLSFKSFLQKHNQVFSLLQLRFCFRASGISCGNLLHDPIHLMAMGQELKTNASPGS